MFRTFGRDLGKGIDSHPGTCLGRIAGMDGHNNTRSVGANPDQILVSVTSFVHSVVQVF